MDKDTLANKLNAPTVFENPEYLSDGYIPERLIYREEEMEKIADEIIFQLKDGIGSHLLVSGPPGTGKTHSLKKLSIEINEQIENNKNVNGTIYFIPVKEKSLYDVFTSLNRKFSDYPRSGISLSRTIEDLAENLAASDQRYVMIFDEVDKMKDTKYTAGESLSDLVYWTTRFGELVKGRIEVLIILVTNNPSVKDKIKAYSRSTFHPEFLFYPQYNAEQLNDIIRDRAEKAFRENIVDDGAIGWLSAHIASGFGDLRYGFQALKIAGKSVEGDPNGDKKITVPILREALEDVENKEITQTVRGLNDVEKLVLGSIILSSSNISKGVDSETLYNNYVQLCAKIGMKERSWAYVRKYIMPNLETQGLLTSSTRGRGRGKGQMLIFYPRGVENLREVVENVMLETYNLHVKKSENVQGKIINF